MLPKKFPELTKCCFEITISNVKWKHLSGRFRKRFYLQVTPVLFEYSEKKNRLRAILKENKAKYISLERLINVDF